jgi:hypothetical protein
MATIWGCHIPFDTRHKNKKVGCIRIDTSSRILSKGKCITRHLHPYITQQNKALTPVSPQDLGCGSWKPLLVTVAPNNNLHKSLPLGLTTPYNPHCKLLLSLSKRSWTKIFNQKPMFIACFPGYEHCHGMLTL